MRFQQKVDALIQQAAELPDEDQAELVQTLLEMRSQHLGIYPPDDGERPVLTSDQKIE